VQGAVLRETGQPELDLVDDLALAEVTDGVVRVAVRATGVCHTDLSMLNGVMRHPLPCVLGHEGAGEVVEVGPGVSRLRVGDRVIVANVPPCGSCSFCLTGQATLCTTIAASPLGRAPRFVVGGVPAYGLSGTGTFAEELLLPEQAAVKIDDDIPWDIASLIGCGVTTGVGAAVNAAKVTPGSSVVVLGCGGVGIAVVQGARMAGAAEIVAIDLKTDKREAARRFGATHAAHPDDIGDVIAEVTKGIGFDFGFEVIGLPATIRAAYDAVRRGGTVTVVGAGSASDTLELNAFELFFHQKTLKGTFLGSCDVRVEYPKLVRLWRAGRLDLDGMITTRGTLADVNTALDDLRAARGIRTVLTF
jgi:S-(hydroxymethyl)glutathione dehydrogenase/alcohol dehydrogenase